MLLEMERKKAKSVKHTNTYAVDAVDMCVNVCAQYVRYHTFFFGVKATFDLNAILTTAKDEMTLMLLKSSLIACGTWDCS